MVLILIFCHVAFSSNVVVQEYISYKLSSYLLMIKVYLYNLNIYNKIYFDVNCYILVIFIL